MGTPAERRAARYVLRTFAALGLRGSRERFPVSHFPVEIGGRLIFASCALLVVLGALLVPAWPLLSALAWGLAGFLVNAPWRVAGFLGDRWPPRTSSANLLATLPEPAGDAPARVIFMAHYDTKSQLLPTGVRVGLVCTATLLCAVLALHGLALATGLTGPAPGTGPWGLAAAVVLLLGGLVANVSGNRSPGALDNGSAVGTLLELARSWRPRSGVPAEVAWVASGSEELGLDGARHFLRLREAWWREKPTLLINLESVGAGARVYLAGEPQALRLAENVAGELGLPQRRLRVLGAGMDHEPFAARGLAAFSILGDVVGKSFALHTRRDDMGLIEPAALERAGRLAAHIAWRWAEMHRPALRAFCADRGPLVGDSPSAAVALGPGSPADGGEVEGRRDNVTPSAGDREGRT